jgi:hypothetical protein
MTEFNATPRRNSPLMPRSSPLRHCPLLDDKTHEQRDTMDKTHFILSPISSGNSAFSRGTRQITRTKLANFASPCGTPEQRDKTDAAEVHAASSPPESIRRAPPTAFLAQPCKWQFAARRESADSREIDTGGADRIRRDRAPRDTPAGIGSGHSVSKLGGIASGFRPGNQLKIVNIEIHGFARPTRAAIALRSLAAHTGVEIASRRRNRCLT